MELKQKIIFDLQRTKRTWISLLHYANKTWAIKPDLRTYSGRWTKFEVFFSDMGVRPPGMVLCRHDTNEGFTAGNCYWGTPNGTGIPVRPL